MSEDPNRTATAANAPEPGNTSAADPVRAPPPARRGGAVAWLALLVAPGAAGWHAWQWQQARDSARADAALAYDSRVLEEQIALLERQIEMMQTEQSRVGSEVGNLRSRLADADRVNRSLREEVLGVGERAALIEDTVARLAERRLEGQSALRLDEAESLLRTAYERQHLFHDRGGALAALRLADAALAAAESAQLVNLRQTLAREIAELAAVRDVDRPALARRLDDLRGIVARLPEARPVGDADADEIAAPTLAERLRSALAKVVVVRRIGPEAEFERFPVEARRAAAALEIELLRASLAARDDEGWRRGTERVGHLLSEGFDPNVATLATARDIVSELSAARLVPAAPAPESTLRELGNLRAMRSLVRAPPPSPAPALEAPEPPAHEDDENGEDSHDADTDEDDS